MTLDQKIEGLLFFKGEPISVKKLAEFLGVKKDEVNEALKLLEEKLADLGLTLIHNENEVMLGTKSELGPILEKIRKEELSKELSKASLETLSVILYKDGVARSEIDYIRGVNSSFILRNLLVRGLIEKTVHPTDSRRYIYKPSFDLLAYLGISNVSELPGYLETKAALDSGDIQEEPEEGEMMKEVQPESNAGVKIEEEISDSDEDEDEDDFDDEDDEEDEEEIEEAVVSE